jgi:tetratricopeptide (TPR) repeat protein
LYYFLFFFFFFFFFFNFYSYIYLLLIFLQLEMEEDLASFQIRNHFLIGNYQAAVNEAMRMPPSLDRDVILYRCYVAQDPVSAVGEMRSAQSQPELAVLRDVARYFAAADVPTRARVGEEVAAHLERPEAAGRPVIPLLVAAVLVAEGRLDVALRALHGCPLLEAKALSVQVYILMNQLEHAEREVARMLTADGEATETTLASIWLAVAQKSSKLPEAIDVLGEVMEKWAATPLLLNVLAAAHMVQADYVMAETVLLQALEMNPRHADSLVNLVVASRFLQRPAAVTSRYLRQLKDVQPAHPWLLKVETSLEAFAASAQKFH